MKIVAFADVHESLTARRKVEALIKKEQPDLAICAGDFTVFEQHVEEMMNWMNKLPVPVLLIHGNHEEEVVVKKMASHRQNITFIHKKPTVINDILFIGYGGGGFDVVDRGFEQYSKDIDAKVIKAASVVLVTHGPPHGCKLDHLHKDHVGNKSYSHYIKKHQNIVLALSGHIHENAEKEDMLNRARLINPGPHGKVITV